MYVSGVQAALRARAWPTGWLWRGNVPTDVIPPPSPPFGALFVLQQQRDETRRSWTWAGNVPLAEQPELYRQLVAGTPQQPIDLNRTQLFSGCTPVAELPELYRLIVQGQQPVHRQGPFLWAGNVPNAEQPELYRTILGTPQPPPDVPRSFLHAGNVPIAEQVELYRSIITTQQPHPQRNSFTWAGNVPAPFTIVPPEFRCLLVRQDVRLDSPRTFLWAGNTPRAEQPELYRQLITRTVGVVPLPSSVIRGTFLATDVIPVVPEALALRALVVRPHHPTRPGTGWLWGGFPTPDIWMQSPIIAETWTSSTDVSGVWTPDDPNSSTWS